jgi:hypothetical protein
MLSCSYLCSVLGGNRFIGLRNELFVPLLLRVKKIHVPPCLKVQNSIYVGLKVKNSIYLGLKVKNLHVP